MKDCNFLLVGKIYHQRQRHEGRRYQALGLGKNKESRYFVSNLPEDCQTNDLVRAFGEFGEFSRGYVAKKKDNQGNLFGFISFRNVGNEKELEMKLDNTKMGNLIMKVNLARYTYSNVSDQNPQVRQKEAQYKAPPVSGRRFEGGISFVDALTGTGKASTKEKVIVIPDGTNEFSSWHGRALIGRVVNFSVLRSFNVLAWEAGVHGMNIQYLGGLQLFLSFDTSEMSQLFLDNKNLWGNWFSSMSMWNGQSFPFERIAWIRLHGIPLHLLNKNVINKIGGEFGKVVQPSELSWEEGNLSYDCVGVLTDKGSKFFDEVTLKWRDKTYRCWISEELGEWVPDCLEKLNQPSPEKKPDSEELPKPTGEEERSKNLVENPFDSSKIDGNMDGLEECGVNAETLNGFGNKSGEKGFYWEPATTAKSDPKAGGTRADGIKASPEYKAFKAQRVKTKKFVQSLDSSNDSFGFFKPLSRKRPRLDYGDDPFGIDEFLGIKPKGNAQDRSVLQNEGIPDLNDRVSSNQNSFVDPDRGISENKVDSRVVDSPIARTEFEIQETIKVGKLLGIDLTGFEKHLEEMINGEGILRLPEFGGSKIQVCMGKSFW